jgi:hypothetical protein
MWTKEPLAQNAFLSFRHQLRNDDVGTISTFKISFFIPKVDSTVTTAMVSDRVRYAIISEELLAQLSHKT